MLKVKICAAIWFMAVVVLSASSSHAEVTFDWVEVGNPGNAPDPLNSDTWPGIGAVDYEFAIAAFEVTNDQYAAFLNAVAADDTHGLFNESMGTDTRGGITKSGSPGSFTYAVKANMGEKPVNYVSYFDAMRFVNWLHNGQLTGAQDVTTTEDGVYAINDGLSEVRAPTARFFVPNQNEWYKAAYHQPAADGGDVDDYWLYPTASNTAPTPATADFFGNISNPGPNVANYQQNAGWNGEFGNVVTVGSAGVQSRSYYGTSNQAGNIWEWNETVLGNGRALLGGYWGDTGFFMQSSTRFQSDPAIEDSVGGIRVASPPPTCLPGAINNGDSDDSGFVDLADFGRMLRCLAGPGQNNGVCACFDTNSDGDVDLNDASTVFRFFENAPVGCVIDGVFYPVGQREPADFISCRWCDPAVSETQWVPIPAGTECFPPVEGFPCDEPEVCNGVDPFCPGAEVVLCELGEQCFEDNNCVSGSCNGGICTDGNAIVRSTCDSDPDCIEGWVCEGGRCLGALSSICVLDDQCASGLTCDELGSGQCRIEIGGECILNGQCPTNATCDGTPSVCVLNLNESCSTNDQCRSGLCSCGVLQVDTCPIGQTCEPTKCAPEGLCKVPLGGACNDNIDCNVIYQRGEPVTDGNCANGVCEPGLLFIGAICETNPRPGGARCVGGDNDGQNCSSQAACPGGACQAGQVPQLGESPNDELCGSQNCFKGAGGEFGPCTPASLCDESTTNGLAGAPCFRDIDCPNGACLNKCGNFTNPPDYKCCRPDGGVCRSDFDCCGGFLQRARGCKSPDTNGTRRCGPLGIFGDPCTTDFDCIRGGELLCIEGICGGPPVDPVLVAGDACDPEVDNGNGFCGPGLICLNCEPEGRGFRCADANRPCCNSGGYDEFFCGSKVLGDSIFGNYCCDYACVDADDDQNCGACGRDCTITSEEGCWLIVGGTCEFGGAGLSCLPQRQYRACPDPDPTDDFSFRCEPREPDLTNPDEFECTEVYSRAVALDYSPLCLGFEDIETHVCTNDAHCVDPCGVQTNCTCGTPLADYNFLFDPTTPGNLCVCP